MALALDTLRNTASLLINQSPVCLSDSVFFCLACHACSCACELLLKSTSYSWLQCAITLFLADSYSSCGKQYKYREIARRQVWTAPQCLVLCQKWQHFTVREDKAMIWSRYSLYCMGVCLVSVTHDIRKAQREAWYASVVNFPVCQSGEILRLYFMRDPFFQDLKKKKLCLHAISPCFPDMT